MATEVVEGAIPDLGGKFAVMRVGSGVVFLAYATRMR
jgi:hypothetical protein